MPNALLVEDDQGALTALSTLVQREGFETVAAPSLSHARRLLRESEPIDVVIADLRLPDGVALDLIDELKVHANTAVIVLTGYGSVDSAVRAFRGGAVDYLTKPVDWPRLRAQLRSIQRERTPGTDEASTATATPGPTPRERLPREPAITMIGESAAMARVVDRIRRVARSRASVLITGESGTGKELVARAIHEQSGRPGPFVALNCGALPATLIESELFGHEKGTFSGALTTRIGHIEYAHEGTLFLDEIGEMPNALQVRLLRVLETGRVLRLGSNEARPVDVRVVSATHRAPDPNDEDDAWMRRDLYYRLNVFPIALPPLRQREGDVRGLVDYRLARLNGEAERSVEITEAALRKLEAHTWPGNIRELNNAIDRAFLLSDGTINTNVLKESLADAPAPAEHDIVITPGTTIAEAEKRLILATLESLGGDKRRTARTLGVSVKTLYSRLNRYGAR